MDKLKSPSIIALFLIIIAITAQSISAQNNVVSKFERVTDLDAQALKISFHSWGEGRTEELNLDQYFPVKRDPNSRYVYLAPPEISVSIDQTSGVARLTAFRDWTGTREIIFSLTDIYNLETTLGNLQKYREIITQQRAPVRLKQEFEDLPSYHLFEKILDDLESDSILAPSPKTEVAKVGNNIKVSLGKEVNILLDLETLTEENIPTLKPKIEITIQPEKEQARAEEGEGLSIFVFIPLILIVITLLIIGLFYIKNNKDKIKKHFRKEKEKPTAYGRLMSQRRELSSISSRLDRQPAKESENEVFSVIKNFFNTLTPGEYQFSYSEIKKEQIERGLSEALKDRLCKFSKGISDIRFSGKETSKAELRNLIRQTQQLITSASNEEKLMLAKKEHEVLRKKFPINVIKYVLDSFTPGKKEISVARIREKIDVKKKSQSILHRLGIIKTLAEKEFGRKRKYLQKLRKIKEKERSKELEKRREEAEKRRKELLKIREKQQKDHLKWLEAQRKIREIERRLEEKRKRRLAGARAVRKFFHDKFGLFKTVKDLEKELEEKRKKRLEKERLKKIERRKKKQSVLNFLHFLRLYKTQEEKHEEELILKREERLKRQEKERKREARKQSVLNFLHALKLYRTQEEVEREKERRLRKLREKQRKKEEEYRRKELERIHERRLKQNEKLKKLEEKKRKQHLKALEKGKKAREKELAKERRKEYLNKKNKEIRKYLHDNLGLFKTLEEKEHEREKKYHKKLKKERENEQKRLEALKKKQQQKLRKQKIKEIKVQAEKKKNEIREKEKKLGRERSQQRKKIREQKIADIKKSLYNKKINLKNFLHRQFHDHFGSYKTRSEIERQKENIRKKITQEQQKNKERKLESIERKRKLKNFFHDRFGLFKTREEIERSRLERREHRIELEHKLEDTVLKSLASRLERKKLSPEQEIKVLMQLEEEALKKGDTEKSEEIKKRINKLYGKVRKSKPGHQYLILNKLKNDLESARDYIFSSTSKLDSLSPFIKKLNSTIRASLTPRIESAKLDQINYLVNKTEIELRRNRKEDAKEYYRRAVYLYRSMNKASQEIALPILLKTKNEITSTAIADSLEKAFGAIYTGQIKKAEKIYKNIDINFLNLPTAEREKIYDRKEELYQKIKEQREEGREEKPVKKQKSSIGQAITNLFKRKEKNKNFYPLIEERFEERFKQRLQPRISEEKPREEKPKEISHKKKESLMDFILARKPRFTSIKTEIESKNYRRALTQKLLGHIRSAERHLENKNHENAHHNYKQAIDIFKDIHLKPEIRDNVYKHLNELKEKIIHTSIHNFMKKTKDSVEKEEIEQAKKFHKSLEGIYNHLQRKREKEIPVRAIDENISDSLLIERKLNEAFTALRKNNLNEAFSLYDKINSHYNNLKPDEKKGVYPRLITLYSELMKKQGK